MNETTRKTLEQVVEECGRYPFEAFDFVRAGLNFTVQKLHGSAADIPDAQCHVSGQELCEGLRQYALLRYGLMAKAVLNHWHINRTSDFGHIVWAMVEARLMQKTEEDDIHDFDDVYDFRTAFEPPARPERPQNPSFQL